MAGRPPKKIKNNIAKAVKARAFTFLIYPESWKTWESDLRSLHMPIVVSPLHDRDVWTIEDERNNDDHVAGELKKQHRHAIISWSGPASISAALGVLGQFGINHIEPISSYQSYCRYLVHLDDPDKAQYDVADVVCLSGGVPDFDKKLTTSELMEQRDEIMKLCDENGVCEYADLCDYCRFYRHDWRQDVYMNTIFWRGYFSSARHRALHE